MAKQEKTLEKLSKQETFSRDDLLVIINEISMEVIIDSFARVLDVKEKLGFFRFIGIKIL